MIIAATGHRPKQLVEFYEKGEQHGRMCAHEHYLALVAFAKQQLVRSQASVIVTGMALGWDTAIADAACSLQLPYIAAIPFVGQDTHWRYRDVVRYQRLLGGAAEQVVVNKGRTLGEKFNRRNEWMVDKAQSVLALWSGVSGGTANCVRYAMSVEKVVDNVWDAWVLHVEQQFGAVQR